MALRGSRRTRAIFFFGALWYHRRGEPKTRKRAYGPSCSKGSNPFFAAWRHSEIGRRGEQKRGAIVAMVCDLVIPFFGVWSVRNEGREVLENRRLRAALGKMCQGQEGARRRGDGRKTVLVGDEQTSPPGIPSKIVGGGKSTPKIGDPSAPTKDPKKARQA
ncbi:hypothetical protein GWK47_037244 [Chionoecetes opilio]|uniref:Uncharacterized protein n=1 Tax=Chionoecetes opilio TaxID=41210 RepID=A0A8J4YDS2_CHIOP|nr:hypothetical protein GWK47_037244 [Chionoecetes opilio]